MSTAGTQMARAARDTLADLLGLGTPYPLRDVMLDYAAEVPHGLSTDLFIRGAQSGVVYQLCTEEGEPLKGIDGRPLGAQLSAGHGGEPTQDGSPVFVPGDLRDAAALLTRLTPAATGAGLLLRRRLRPATRALLDAGNAAEAGDAVLRELDRIVRLGPLYDPGAFRDVCLSPWTRQLLLKAGPTDAERIRLNRFLLEDAFPLALWRTLTLATPPVTEDVTFTLLASREDNVLVEVPLTARASVRAGIAATLPVHFLPGTGTAAVVAYGGTPVAAVDDSQEGVSYQLFSDANPPVQLSDPVLGNRVTVTLAVNRPLQEDTGIKVKAFRTSAPADFRYLATGLQVQVGPNPAVAVQAAPALADYGGTSLLSLAQAQTTVTYTLWQRPVAPSDYAPPAAPGVQVSVPADPAADPPWFRFVGSPAVVNGQSRLQLSVSVPDLGDGTAVPAGFTVVGDFKTAGGAPQVAAGPLREDTLFVVRASKANGTSLVLDQKTAVLVRPDPQPSLTAARSPVPRGAPGAVLVGNAQQGVRYRLLRDADGAPVLNPGYHHDDRVLETTRLETDFLVEAPGDQPIVLPTGPLTGPMKFRVTAIKNATGLTAPLAGTVSIDVAPS